MSVGCETLDLRNESPYQNPFRLEVLDYIPLVSTVSGVARAVFGVVETALGAVIFPIELVGRVCRYKQPFTFVYGVSNIVRGSIAAEPVVGNIILYLYDHSPVIKRDFRRATGIDVN